MEQEDSRSDSIYDESSPKLKGARSGGHFDDHRQQKHGQKGFDTRASDLWADCGQMSLRPRQTADVERGDKPPDQQVFRDFGAGDDGPMP